jgi:hypothetical protein
MPESAHLSIRIERPAAAVYGYAGDPANLPQWAAGLAESAVRMVEGRWVADSPMGEVGVQFAPPNEFGVLDHDVTLPGGQVVYNPMRVIPDGDGSSEVIFTVRHRPEMSDDEFAHDQAAVAADLAALKRILETAP